MPSKKKTQPPTSGADTRPLSLESVIRTNYEPPRRERPDAMASFMGWNGFILDRGSPEQRLGFTPVKTQRDDIKAWVMTAQVPYQFGLPILSTQKLSAGGIAFSEDLRCECPIRRGFVTWEG